MRPIRLVATNYVRFPKLAVDFSDGSCAITGANGAGKSAVLRALDLALFADGSRDLAQWLGPFAERMEVALEFEHARERYRVRRGYKGGASAKATLDLEHDAWLEWPQDNPNIKAAYRRWTPLTRESAKATQALLESLTGLSRRTFSASAYLAQGQAGTFTEASPSDRKAILSDALDPRGFWPAKAQQAADERKQAERALEADLVRIRERQETAADHDQVAEALEDGQIAQAEAQRTLDCADETLASAQAALAANAAAAARLKAAEEAHAQATTARGRAQTDLEAAKAEAENAEPARAALAEATSSAGRVAELERLVEEQRQAAGAYAEAIRAIRDADERVAAVRDLAQKREREFVMLTASFQATRAKTEQLAHAADGAEHCDRCGQLLGEEARATALAGLRRELVDIGEQVNVAEVEVAQMKRALTASEEVRCALPAPKEVAANGYDAQLRQARTAAEQRGVLALQAEQAEQAAARVPALLEAFGEADLWMGLKAAERARLAEEAQDGPRLEVQAASARSRQREARAALDEAQAHVVRLGESLARIEQARRELTALQSDARERQERLDLLRLAERAFGRDGVPVLLVESALGQIEAAANGYLAMMPTSDGATLRVQLETQRAQKTVDHLRETLDVNVSDMEGARAYETFSGGERARVNIALRLALAILLADRRGAESRLLAIDEIEGLDSEGQAQLVEVVRSVASRFDVVLVASHYGGIRDAFDSVIEVAKDDGVSRLAVA